MWSWWPLSGWRLQLWLSSLKLGVQPVAGDDHHDVFFFVPKNSDSTSGNLWKFSSMPFFYSTHIPMFTVLDPLLEFTYHLLFSWRKFALFIQSLLCMLFLFGWSPCQRSDMILMEVSQHAYDMIHYISGLFGYFYAWSSIAQSVCQRAFSLLAIWCLGPRVQILPSAKKHNLSPFDLNIACLCQSIEINNNKYVYSAWSLTRVHLSSAI